MKVQCFFAAATSYMVKRINGPMIFLGPALALQATSLRRTLVQLVHQASKQNKLSSFHDEQMLSHLPGPCDAVQECDTG